ncbi:MAG TPA: prolyl oligopeptidase family serine peptidase, partial [Alphaproteobacteria bacterium]|nr:prolyl oligopeptidase family serine peptidase [Alphaproteobacteria bacterium]
AAAVSQPGYGGSDGPPDYSGPATQRAIRVALAYLRGLPGVDPDRMVLYGVSRGAIASSVVAADEPNLRALVLISGAYDFAAAYPLMPPSIRKNVEREAGLSPEAFESRTALRVADRIRAATLILHGRRDFLPSAQAEALAAALKANGTEASVVLLESGHSIPPDERLKAVKPFLSRVIGQPF